MKSYTKFAVPIGVVGIVLMLVVPLPAWLLDILITFNITTALLIVLVSMNIKRPLEFSAFPSLLLICTMARLGLNVSSTRLVLTDGYAGKVIDAFGHIVISGSLIVGLVVFTILCIIQFVVITNGAGRVAEVGARFTLDAMPGKQMAIDADLNAGLIDQDEARKRRAEVSAEADFHGAMDGASKFVKGDAIASVIVTIINLLGGFAVGVLSKGMSMGDAVQQYSLLTVGDGLVTQIPALLMSTATGLIVTRSAASADMGSDILRQFARHHQAMQIAGGAMLGLMLVPGMPKTPFAIAGGTMFVLAWRANISTKAADAAEESAAPVPDPPRPDSPEVIAESTRIDPLELEVAYDLVDLVDTARGGDLLERVKALRRKVALDSGLVMPLVRTKDNLDLPSGQYVIHLNGVPVAKGVAPAGTVLAIGDRLGTLPGTDTQEPVFGLTAKWVPADMQRQAEITGATVVDRSSVITTHLAEIVKQNAPSLLGREDVRILVEMIKRSHPAVIEELTPALLSLGEIQRVLQALLEEQVSIRDHVRIFEALSLAAKTSTDVDTLVNAARNAIGPAVSAPYIVHDRLYVITLDPMLEHSLLEAQSPTGLGQVLRLDAPTLDVLVKGTTEFLTNAERLGINPVLVCSPQLRTALARTIRQVMPRLPVISYTEVNKSVQIESVGVVASVFATVG
ncbi:flagellar biosynthesis protein FlhA [Tessaracoccus sp.]